MFSAFLTRIMIGIDEKVIRAWQKRKVSLAIESEHRFARRAKRWTSSYFHVERPFAGANPKGQETRGYERAASAAQRRKVYGLRVPFILGAPRPLTGRYSLNNNRNNNNRRRGRGSRNNQGSGNNQNRIDSRARGNAPQLLDKYKKLAQDAQHNGDRVQAEYYLQFADHYFRVIADNKARQDESRAKRGDTRSDDRAGNSDDGDEDDGDGRRRNNRRPRGRRDAQEGDNQDEAAQADEGDAASEGVPSGSDEETVKPKRQARKPRAEKREESPDEKPRRRSRKPKANADADEGAGIDAAVLPPAISSGSGSGDADDLEATG